MGELVEGQLRGLKIGIPKHSYKPSLATKAGRGLVEEDLGSEAHRFYTFDGCGDSSNYSLGAGNMEPHDSYAIPEYVLGRGRSGKIEGSRLQGSGFGI